MEEEAGGRTPETFVPKLTPIERKALTQESVKELRNIVNKVRPRPRMDWDVRGLLAILAMFGAFGIGIIQLAGGHPNGAEIPAWAAALVSGVAGFYFGSRGGGSKNGANSYNYTGPGNSYKKEEGER